MLVLCRFLKLNWYADDVMAWVFKNSFRWSTRREMESELIHILYIYPCLLQFNGCFVILGPETAFKATILSNLWCKLADKKVKKTATESLPASYSVYKTAVCREGWSSLCRLQAVTPWMVLCLHSRCQRRWMRRSRDRKSDKHLDSTLPERGRARGRGCF